MNLQLINGKRIVFLFPFLFSCMLTFSQKKIQVKDNLTQEPIQDVVVSNSTFVTISNLNGFIEVPSEIDTLFFNHINYKRKVLTSFSSQIFLDQENLNIQEIVVTNKPQKEILQDAIADLRKNFDYENKLWGTFFLDGEHKDWRSKFILNVNSIVDKGNYNIVKGNVLLKNNKVDSSSVFPLIPFHYALYYNDIFNPQSKFYRYSSFKKYKQLTWEYSENGKLSFHLNIKKEIMKSFLTKDIKLKK